MKLAIIKHPTENKARVVAKAETPEEQAQVDLLFQALLSSSRRQGAYTSTDAIDVMFETSPEWKNDPQNPR